MNQLIDEVKAVPGVIGACLYSSQNGLQGNNLPKFFKAERLAALGQHLFKLHAAGRMNFDDLTDLSLHYDESVLVVREIQNNLLVLAICDPSFNPNLLTMSFNLLQEEVRSSKLANLSAESNSVTFTVATPAPKAGKKLADERLLDLFSEMKNKLSKVLGPMAGYIFDETLTTWRQEGGGAGAKLDQLLSQLEAEIADEDKIVAYRRLIAPALRVYREG